jgi:hypothetical protein
MDIEVARSDLTRWRVVDADPAPLGDGEARLRIDRFGFSSNNISYAVIGDLLRYWEAFPAAPADDGDDTMWGRVPVWGFAEVVESRSPAVHLGERLFGFLPMSTELVIEPGRASPSEVWDVAPHRSVLAGPYNAYRRCGADPAYRADREELQMLLYPLFFTSFVIDDFLADHGDFGATQVVISSASAKTALGAACLLHARGVRTVGLTSTGNVAFCGSLGVYDVVVPYDAVGALDQVPSAFIDVSGDQGVVGAVHRRLGDALAHSMIVGDTHWDSPPDEDGSPRPGPVPAFLFAPSQITKRNREWGPEVLAATMAEAWARYADWAEGWLTLERSSGPDAVIDVFRTYLSGRVDPRIGTVCTLRTEEVSS